MSWQILQGDALTVLRDLESASVQTCITSPPFWGLRDYGVDGQLGLEPTPEQYVANLVEVFREVRRVLRGDGTVWLNLGDSYVGAPRGNAPGDLSTSSLTNSQRQDRIARPQGTTSARVGRRNVEKQLNIEWRVVGLKPKDLVGIPWRVAFALQAIGWWLRSDIIWSKPNPMPESVMDRPTRSHEYIFLLTKSGRYFYDADAIREEAKAKNWRDGTGPGYAPPGQTEQRGNRKQGGHGWRHEGFNDRWSSAEQPYSRNKRSVWTVATQPYSEAHFATFAPKLIEPCVLAGSSERACGDCGAPWKRQTERIDQGFDGSRYGERAVEATGGAIDGGTQRSTLGSSAGKLTGKTQTIGWQPTCEHTDDSGSCTVLDPFAGSGTTGLVALRHNRSFIGIELNPEYVEMARNRIRDDAPLFNVHSEAR